MTSKKNLNRIQRSVNGLRPVHGVLVDIEDYLEHISLMATLVSDYKIDEDHPGSDDLQVRMIGRLADQALKMLKPAAEKLDDISQETRRILQAIELQKIETVKDFDERPSCDRIHQ